MTDADYTVRRLDKRIDSMMGKGPQIEFRSGIPVPAVSALTLGSASVDVSVTWETPFPSATYAITKPQIDIGAIGLLGKADAKVKAGSQTATGCVITVTTTSVLAIGQLTVSVLAYRKPS